RLAGTAPSLVSLALSATSANCEPSGSADPPGIYRHPATTAGGADRHDGSRALDRWASPVLRAAPGSTSAAALLVPVSAAAVFTSLFVSPAVTRMAGSGLLPRLALRQLNTLAPKPRPRAAVRRAVVATRSPDLPRLAVRPYGSLSLRSPPTPAPARATAAARASGVVRASPAPSRQKSTVASAPAPEPLSPATPLAVADPDPVRFAADFAKIRVCFEEQTQSLRLSVPPPRPAVAATSATSAAAPGDCLFPLDTSRPLSELLTGLQEEFSDSVARVSATRGQFEHVAHDADRISLAAFVRGSFVLWLHPRSPAAVGGRPLSSSSQPASSAAAMLPARGLVVDKAELVGLLAGEQAALAETRTDLTALEAVRASADARVDWAVFAIRATILAAMAAQLAAIAFFTYKIGWDVMEPVSYIVGLVNATAVGLVVLGVSEDADEAVRQWLRAAAYRRRGLDADRLRTLADRSGRLAQRVTALRSL
ncbi:hypothetical protein HK405_012237, partial [Cladochytrium tenue]